MSVQIRPSVTNPTLAAIYREIDSGLLVLAPDFQRRFVWTRDHQEEFIETILKGLPFPEIYVCTGELDLENMRTTRLVIDGQQRLTTIRNYVQGVGGPFGKVKPFASLSDEEKGVFLQYEIVIRDLGRVSQDVVREIFRRINLTKFQLDSVEIHNAVYDGQFISTAKRIVDTVDLKVFGVFRESEFSRMSDLHFVLTVMATLEAEGYFLQDSAVEAYIQRYNEEYANGERMYARIRETFELIGKLDLPPDSMWFRKANFFTLVVEMSINLGALRDDLRDCLVELEEKVMANKRKENEFGLYYSYMYQNTAGRNARVIRGDLFRKFCVK